VQSRGFHNDGALVQPSQRAVEPVDFSFRGRVQVLGLRGVRHAADGVGRMLGLPPRWPGHPRCGSPRQRCPQEGRLIGTHSCGNVCHKPKGPFGTAGDHATGVAAEANEVVALVGPRPRTFRRRERVGR
jgi:hypothetical protein